MFNPSRVPKAARPKSPVAAINAVGNQPWEDNDLGNGPCRILTVQVWMPKSQNVDLDALWASTIDPLIAMGANVEETARIDVTETLPEGYHLEGKGASHFFVEKDQPNK